MNIHDDLHKHDRINWFKRASITFSVFIFMFGLVGMVEV